MHPVTGKAVQPHKGFDKEEAHKIVALVEHKQGWASEANSRYSVLENGELARNMNGLEIPRKYASLKLTGKNNYISALMMVNVEFNKRLGKSRNSATVEDFKAILENLDDIIKPLTRRLRKAKSDYEESQT